MSRKLTRSGAIRKLDALWSLCIKARDKRCAMCGRTENLNAHHCVVHKGVGASKTRWILDNGITLCPRCHMGIHNHNNASFVRQYEAIRDARITIERQEEIIRLRHEVAKYSMEDLEGIYENLAKEYDKIKGAL